MNKTKNDQTDYINATKECFARAFQQYFGIKTEGEDAITKNVDNKVATEGIEIWKHPNFVNKFTFKDEIEPLIEQFLKENLDVFETTVDIDGTNDLVPITVEENKVVEEVKTEDVLKIFKDIVLESKSFDEAFDKVSNVQGVPREVSAFFLDKYRTKNTLDKHDVFLKFYTEVKGEQAEEQEESIEDLIEGLKVMIEYSDGAEKEELENTIEGLKLLL
jgi:hypothetical protein